MARLIQCFVYSLFLAGSTRTQLCIVVSVSSCCVVFNKGSDTRVWWITLPQFGIWLYWSLSHMDIQCTHWFVPILIIFIAMNVISQKFTRFYVLDGIFGNTTSTLKVPLLPVGLLLRLLNQAMRCLLPEVHRYAFLFRTWSTLLLYLRTKHWNCWISLLWHFPIQDSVYSLHSSEDQVLNFLCLGSTCCRRSFFIWDQV